MERNKNTAAILVSAILILEIGMFVEKGRFTPDTDCLDSVFVTCDQKLLEYGSDSFVSVHNPTI